MNEFPRCPYCGSIEIFGNICFWCHNPVTDDIPDEQFTNNKERNEHFMKIELKFTDLTYEEAEKLIKAADGSGIEGKAAMSETQSVPNTSAVSSDVMPTGSAVPTAAQFFAAPLPTAPVPASAATSAPQTLPTAVKTYDVNELALAARPIAEAGRQQELINLIHTFTVTDASGATRPAASIRDLTPEQYPAFANGLRQLGGRI